MTRRHAGLLLLAALVLSRDAFGQGTPSYAPLTLRVACGEVFNPVCAKVLPRIAARTAQAGLNLQPVQSGGALDAAAVVCAGQVAAAVVPRDAMAQYSHQPACLGRFDVVGPALYPLYALLLVKADAPFRQLDDLARDGRRTTIAAGDEGSGGRTTLALLSASSPGLQQSISVTDDDVATALQRIAEGSIDGLFAMESLAGELIDRARLKTDAHGQPLYRFIDVRPGPEVFRAGDGGGHCLYRLTALDFGGPEPVTTVSTDAVLMLARISRDAHARGGPRAVDALASAIEATRGAILADMKSPGDWRPPNTSCQ
jgi:hypothetical protein